MTMTYYDNVFTFYTGSTLLHLFSFSKLVPRHRTTPLFQDIFESRNRNLPQPDDPEQKFVTQEALVAKWRNDHKLILHSEQKRFLAISDGTDPNAVALATDEFKPKQCLKLGICICGRKGHDAVSANSKLAKLFREYFGTKKAKSAEIKAFQKGMYVICLSSDDLNLYLHVGSTNFRTWEMCALRLYKREDNDYNPMDESIITLQLGGPGDVEGIEVRMVLDYIKTEFDLSKTCSVQLFRIINDRELVPTASMMRPCYVTIKAETYKECFWFGPQPEVRKRKAKVSGVPRPRPRRPRQLLSQRNDDDGNDNDNSDGEGDCDAAAADEDIAPEANSDDDIADLLNKVLDDDCGNDDSDSDLEIDFDDLCKNVLATEPGLPDLPEPVTVTSLDAAAIIPHPNPDSDDDFDLNLNDDAEAQKQVFEEIDFEELGESGAHEPIPKQPPQQPSLPSSSSSSSSSSSRPQQAGEEVEIRTLYWMLILSCHILFKILLVTTGSNITYYSFWSFITTADITSNLKIPLHYTCPPTFPFGVELILIWGLELY